MTTVKIYRDEDVQDLIHDENEQERHRELISYLGLKAPEEEKVPIVYTILNSGMIKQLTAICPSKEKVKSYSRTTLPIEVLDALKFAMDNEMFKEYQIWYDDVKPDPLLVGKKLIEGSTWDYNYYLIARWGDCALELPKLLELGFQRIKQRLTDSAIDVQNTCINIIKNPDSYVRKIIASKFDSYSSFSKLDID